MWAETGTRNIVGEAASLVFSLFCVSFVYAIMCMFESCSMSPMVLWSMLVALAMSVNVTMPTSLLFSVIGNFLTLSLNINLVASKTSMLGVPVMTFRVMTSVTRVCLGFLHCSRTLSSRSRSVMIPWICSLLNTMRQPILCLFRSCTASWTVAFS